MDSSNSNEIVHEFSPFFRIYKNGKVERITADTETVPPSIDPLTGVQTKDTVVSQENSLSVRLFIPKITDPTQKLPLLIYIHGGAFCIESPFSSLYHNYLTDLVHNANVIAVSVQYRRAPEHPLPAAYDDSWAAIQWVASHVNGEGSESWLNGHADFDRTFLAGDSAGANIAHNMAVRAGSTNGLNGVKIVGVVLAHPFFGDNEPDTFSPVIEFIFPSVRIYDDPRINPAGAGGAELASLGCARVLIFVAGKDGLRDRGVRYYEALKRSGWGGMVEIVETEGEDHVFHLLNPNCPKARVMMEKVVSFINHGR
ncbi:PREDICTED: probable carboxylesterase 5 isoform X2 [Populus euphratica]|uniref:Probable carboxylesterase 5 isoform X1 n=1 Tax=Populus euphratica TaxID=75702 RepID=A0AAJ6TR87_POPEU|nr:PREDICTED: probable carboxylesterase 5 isoform X1 [Populus euphratica]XP_011015828.1 PREDICTED: probable carboxylesterase 5 isoform X2 [Populus euphratica]